ncbi:MAG: hypothetical protein R2711_05865 [Acidimicrobiales bacterium]
MGRGSGERAEGVEQRSDRAGFVGAVEPLMSAPASAVAAGHDGDRPGQRIASASQTPFSCPQHLRGDGVDLRVLEADDGDAVVVALDGDEGAG